LIVITFRNPVSPDLETVKIGVIGLGYVGLPLSILLAKKFAVVGFDTAQDRIADLRAFRDRTREVESSTLVQTRARFSNDPQDLAECNFYIVTVPTPIDDAKRPNLRPLLSACRTIGKVLSQGDVVVFESTVYPGATEEECVPIIAEVSGLVFNQDFVVGYSPERINPGDKTHTIDKIVKVTSGSTPEAADLIDRVYASVITAGTYRAATIKVAEAAKVIENTQRDVNIALVNELSNLFHKLNIDTLSVLAAAQTKWNFLPFRPGLVGGHCVGVDPFYLTHKAQQAGHHPEIILAGRRINDLMGEVVASRFVRLLIGRGVNIATARLLILGFTFKENCPDIRNSRVIDVVTGLREYGCEVDIHDPWADAAEVADQYGLTLLSDIAPHVYDGVIMAVAHDEYRALGIKGIRAALKPNAPVFDVKGILPQGESDLRL
jgi:UDP-N-acetyl-D-glucosamine/UDP-N-acetyl-D-galactosamine dehydrogenase